MLKCGLTYEIIIYFAVYIIYLFYGLWHLYAVRDIVLKVAKFEFDTGWRAIGRPRDDSNDEFENFTAFVRKNWLWYVVHIVINFVVRKWWPRRQSSGHAVITLLALFFSLQYLSMCVFGVLLLTYFTVAKSDSKYLIWITSAFWIWMINLIKNSAFWYETLGYTEYFTLIIILSWSLLRCCSFSLCRVNDKLYNLNKLDQLYTVERYLGYTLYFPCLVYGPFLGFQRYVAVYKGETTKNEIDLFVKFSWEIFRVVFWWFVLQLASHFFYIHYMTRDVSAVQLIDVNFGRHAIGYFMGQFFFLYYVITYGMGIAFARYDGLHPPNRPRCIGCIHFYSDMWKYFDEGLYEFLFKHIYAELCGKQSSLFLKLFATAATFAFVFVWHGCYTYVLIWSALNFGCLVTEKYFKTITSSHLYTKCIVNRLGSKNAMRLRALLGTQLFIPAAFSNVYFISGKEVGDYLMRGAYMNGIWNYIGLTLCSYCFFQCSEVILSIKQS